MKTHHDNNHQPPSSTSSSSGTTSSPPSQPPQQPPSTATSTSDDPTISGGQESISVVNRGDNAVVCRWTVSSFPKLKARALWSKYFPVGGFDCRLLVYPKGDSQALPGYISVYLQVVHPSSSCKWECFTSYRLSILNFNDDFTTISRDSWHRFSSKKKSHGWCDFTPSNAVLDPKSGFLFNSDSILIVADILILNESVTFIKDITIPTNGTSINGTGNSNGNFVSDFVGSNVGVVGGVTVVGSSLSEVLSGKFTWKVHNFNLFKDMIKTQKIMSPSFQAGECNLRISVYQSTVNGVDYLSMCLESKENEKVSGTSGVLVSDRSCWCLFRISVLNQKQGLNHVQRDSYGRFAADNKSGDNTSLGWNDYMKMSDFVGEEAGFLVDDTAVFSTSFHVIKELSSFSKNGVVPGVRTGIGGSKKSDGHSGKFTWKIDNFTRLKDLLKKRKITGLCIKSRRFQIGNRDCRLIVYPRGQSQPPCHVSVFLEVTDSRNTSSDWSCFVSHKLSVSNQKADEKSVTKESQNRYSKAARDWGWREFVTLTSLFDQDSGFLVQDSVIFSAEVLILKETSILEDFSENSENDAGKKRSFTWKVENFLSFKEIMETRKIFSKFFQAGGCELRIGVYESFDTICIYLESDQSAGSDPDENFWVRYRMAVVNQKNSAKTVWKESSICTKTWNNSVLQFMKVSDMLEPEAGFLLRDTVVFVCEILDCCPWFEFSDLEFLASEDDHDALSTDPDELMDSEDSEGISGDEEDIFRNLLSHAGFQLTYGDNPSQPQVMLREKLLMDAGAIAGFLTGLRVYLDDPVKVKHLLLPTKLSGADDAKKASKSYESSPSLMNLLMGVKVLQQAIIDLLLDIMVECCQPSEGNSMNDAYDGILRATQEGSLSTSTVKLETESVATEQIKHPLSEILDAEVGESVSIAVQSMKVSTCTSETEVREQVVPGQPICPPETSAGGSSEEAFLRPKTNWHEQSEELLGLIVNSLRALDGAVPQGCPEPRRRPESAQKIILVLDKAPKYLLADLVALVPKLVERSEHPLAATALLERLQKADAEPALRIPVLGALSQLDCSGEVWEGVLFQSVALLVNSNDEPLAATIKFILNAATQCQRLPEAIRSVRVRLKQLGPEVSPCVLDFLTGTVHKWPDASEAIVRDIDGDNNCGVNDSSLPNGVFFFGENGPPSEILNVVDENSCCGSHYFSDIYLLMEMLSIPCLAVEAAKTFERAVSRGAILAPSVAMVLERRHSQRAGCEARSVTDTAIEGEISFRAIHDDFSMLLGLAETLALSTDPRVKGFVTLLYIMLFKWYADDSYRGKMLKRLIDRATTCTDNSRDLDYDMEILVQTLCEEKEIIRPALSMMREAVVLANVDRAALWHQLCGSEDEIVKLREEQKAVLSKMVEEKALLSQKLIDSESANNRLKSDMKTEMDRFVRAKKEHGEQLQEIERQLEWVRAERVEETAKVLADKRALQDRLHDTEAQLAQLKTRKRDELKRVVKEKNVIAERLKNTEAARKRFDEELKQYATEKVTREEIRQSLEDEVRRLTETVGQTEGKKREKEEQVAQYEAYIDGLDSKLTACQQYIHTLETSLQEEMSRHAPLYGAGLEALSMKELETLSRIHEEGLHQIHALQHQRNVPAPGTSLVSSHGLPHSFFPDSLPHVAPPPSSMAVGLPHNLVNNSSGMLNNGNANGSVGPWFNPS